VEERALSDSGKPLKRAFVQFIMDPICKLIWATLDSKTDVVEDMLHKLEISLTQKEKEETETHEDSPQEVDPRRRLPH